MLSSAPQLAEELRAILGDDPNRWLQEDAEAYPAPPDTQKIQPKALEGKEASSIGVVERSDLYILGGGDAIGSKSPTVTGTRVPPPPRRPPSVVLESPFADEDDSSEDEVFPFTPVAVAGDIEAPARPAPTSGPHPVPAPLPAAPNREPYLPPPFAGAPQLPPP